MSYVNPQTVLVPRDLVDRVDVIHDTGPGKDSWAVALVNWDGEEKVAIRWNGDENAPIGNPQSHGRPTWFIVPNELADALRSRAEELHHATGDIASGYRAMASDTRREAEAEDWVEGLIGDGNS